MLRLRLAQDAGWGGHITVSAVTAPNVASLQALSEPAADDTQPAGAKQQQQQQQGQRQQQAPEQQAGSDYVRAAAACRDLECLTAAAAAHPLLPSSGVHRFPAFMIPGWQKSATTALFGNLINHPAVLSAEIKARLRPRRAGLVSAAVVCCRRRLGRRRRQARPAAGRMSVAS